MADFKKQFRAVLFAGISVTAMMTAAPAQAGAFDGFLDKIADHVVGTVSGQVQQGVDNTIDKGSCSLQGGIFIPDATTSRQSRSGDRVRSGGSSGGKCLVKNTHAYAQEMLRLERLESARRAIANREALQAERLRAAQLKNDVLDRSGQHAGTNSTQNINYNNGSQQSSGGGGFNITSSRDVMPLSEIIALNIRACDSTGAPDCQTEHQNIGDQVGRVGNLQLSATYNIVSMDYRTALQNNPSIPNERIQTKILIDGLNK